MTLRCFAACAMAWLLAGCASPEPAADSSSVPATGQVPSADGVPIAYEVRGSGEPALVLIHGWTNDRTIWGEHPRTLSRTHRVVTVELAGHGQSGAGRTNWTLDAFGEDVAAVVQHLELPSVVLVGFSMGAQAAIEAAERLADRVVGIVIVDTFHDPEQRSTPAPPEQMEAMFRANWGDTAFLRQFAFTPDAPDSLVQMLAANSSPQPREHWFPALHAVAAWMRGERQAALERLSVPVAAINTTRVPTNVEAWRRYVPSFTVDTLQGVGHAGILLQRVEDFDARLLALVERFSNR
ncbi:MAG TPA: alpha/beta hydrolase [Gemmatimonadaceae bacterium]